MFIETEKTSKHLDLPPDFPQLSFTAAGPTVACRCACWLTSKYCFLENGLISLRLSGRGSHEDILKPENCVPGTKTSPPLRYRRGCSTPPCRRPASLFLKVKAEFAALLVGTDISGLLKMCPVTHIGMAERTTEHCYCWNRKCCNTKTGYPREPPGSAL